MSKKVKISFNAKPSYKDSGFKDKDDYIKKQLFPNIFSGKSYSVKTKGR